MLGLNRLKFTLPDAFTLKALPSLGNIKLTNAKLLLACLSIGFFIRLVPELLAGSVPIGFDTIHYAYTIKSGVIWVNWTSLFTSAWLLNALTVPIYNLTQADPFLLLKIVAPLLYGLNVAGICWFARKTLGWSLRMSLVASIFFALQLASLRISWDLLRNTLGLGILLFALSYVKDVGSKRGFALFTGLSLLCVFAHEYAAVILLLTVAGLTAWRLLRKQVNMEVVRLAMGVLPALSVFAIGVYLIFHPITGPVQSNVIGSGDSVSGSAGGLFFLVDYLRVQNSVDSYASYWTLALSIGILFTVLFVPYIVMVVKGYFRNGILNVWTGVLLVGSFSALIVPFSALQYWDRWMFMLVYPFTFYTVNSISKMLNNRDARMRISRKWVRNKKTSAMLLLSLGLGIAYLATPLTMMYASTSIPSLTNTYLYFSTSPTVPYEDVKDVVRAISWLNGAMSSASCAILQQAYQYWGRLYLDQSHFIVTFEQNPTMAVDTAFEHGFNRIYFVWWNKPNGWYGLSVPKSFVSVQSFGRISVYVYGGTRIGGS